MMNQTVNWCHISRVYPDRPLYVLLLWSDVIGNPLCIISVGVN
jgi:hypothetical protein